MKIFTENEMQQALTLVLKGANLSSPEKLEALGKVRGMILGNEAPEFIPRTETQVALNDCIERIEENIKLKID